MELSQTVEIVPRQCSLYAAIWKQHMPPIVEGRQFYYWIWLIRNTKMAALKLAILAKAPLCTFSWSFQSHISVPNSFYFSIVILETKLEK